MSFEERARKSYERKDYVRALIVLVEGLKRNPERAESLDFLLRIYTEHCENPGLERDVLDALVLQPDCESLVGQVCVRLEAAGKESMYRALVQQMRERRLEIIWPPEPIEPEPEPEKVEEAENLPADSESVELADGEEVRVSENPEEGVERAEDAHGERMQIAASVPLLRADISAEVQAARSAVDSSAERRLYIQNETVTSRANRPGRSRVARDNGDARIGGRRPPRAVLIAGVVILLLLVGFGLYRWDDMRVTSRIHRLDAMLTQFDPEQADAFEQALQKAIQATVGESKALRELQNFAKAVTAIESAAENIAQPDDEPVTSWGAGALVLWAIDNNDIERALAETVKLEFTHPDSLSALWVRGRLLEHMGDRAAAQKKYEQTTQQFPRFVPAYLGMARMAARSLDLQGWNQSLENLQKVSAEHPFHRLKLEPALDEVLLSAPSAEASEASDAPDGRLQLAAQALKHGRFYAAMLTYNFALEALDEANHAVARGLAEQAVEYDPGLRIARVLLGALEAMDGDVELASERFLAAVSSVHASDHASIALRMLVQRVAPLSLSASGRADLAIMFTSPVAPAPIEHAELEGRQPSALEELLKEQQAKRPAALDLLTAELVGAHPAAARALLARAYTLNALGAGAQVAESLPVLTEDSPEARQAALEQLVAHIVLNQRQEARRQLGRIAEQSVERHTAEAIFAHLEGRFSDAIEQGNIAYAARPEDPRVLRPLVLSLIESRKGREAITILEQAKVAPIWRGELESLKVRAYARLAMREMLSKELLNQLVDGCAPAEQYSLNQQIDLITASLWLRQNHCAKERIQRSALTPEHPEWTWVSGLYYRAIGERDRAAVLFRKSWRSDQNNPELLVELGSMHLEFERYELAQEAFYAAILRDRGSIEALRGISRTYYAYDRPRGRRDLARMLSNLGSAPHYGPQRAELLKWLAVLHGLREGAPEALSYLEQARQEVGDRADLLIELARYHEARREFAIARIQYANALQKNSTMPEAHYGLAQMAIHAGDYRVASDHLKRFIALTPAGKEQDQAQAQLVQIQTKPVP